MPQHIKITTDFDITNTGVVRNYKKEALPFKTSNGNITTKEAWIKARRQQSNWETLVQIISLRSNPINLRTTVTDTNWQMEFDIEQPDVYRKGDDALKLLKQDCANVPLLTNLNEHITVEPFIIPDGTGQNIKFDTYEI